MTFPSWRAWAGSSMGSTPRFLLWTTFPARRRATVLRTEAAPSSYGLAQLSHSRLLESLLQPRHDRAGDARPFIHHPGIDLDERSPGRDFFPGVSGVENPAHPDDRKFALGLTVDMAHKIRAARPERPPA